MEWEVLCMGMEWRDEKSLEGLVKKVGHEGQGKQRAQI